METPKITKVELELDAVSGELRVMHDLLNIFANWFDETHKTDMIKRERTSELVSPDLERSPDVQLYADGSVRIPYRVGKGS